MKNFNSAEELIPDLINIPTSSTPEPDAVSYFTLEKQRKIYIDFEINENLTCIHRLIMRWNIQDAGLPPEERRPIWIYIMSYGGSVDYCYMLIDAIKASTTPVYTVNIGMASSAGGLIFIAGHKRFMTKSAHVLIHEGSAEMSGDAQKIMDATDSYKKTLKKMKDFILENTDITSKELNKKRSNDWELDSDYCLSHRVCDQVVSSLDEII